MISVYNDTSDAVQKSMATMVLFLQARDLTPEVLRPAAAATSSEPALQDPATGLTAAPRSGDR